MKAIDTLSNTMNPQFGDIVERQVIDEYGNTRLEQVVIGIPQCCREAWDSCPHVIRTEVTKRKVNVGL